MLKPRFVVKTRERIIKNGDLVTNGHWLADLSLITVKNAFRPLTRLRDLADGDYQSGVGHTKYIVLPRDIASIIPKDRADYKTLRPEPVRGVVNGFNVMAYEFQSVDEELTIHLNPNYALLMTLGYCFAKDETSPILICETDDRYGRVIGVIMPVRK